MSLPPSPAGPAPRRLVIVPRWGGGPMSDFYPWLGAELARRRLFDEVAALTYDDPGAPDLESTRRALLGLLGDDRAGLARTVLLGHSVGGQAALRALEALPPGQSVGGLLYVAAWWSVDQPWPTIRPWIETPLDDTRVRAAAGRVVALLSDNDPFTADHVGTGAAFAARLGATVRVVAGARHFNESAEPAVLELLTEHFAG